MYLLYTNTSEALKEQAIGLVKAIRAEKLVVS
jgi:hypothetical protein